MRIVSKEEFIIEIEEFAKSIIDGAIFVYPTDTIYGRGCNALNAIVVKKIREIKKRPNMPFSVIAPSKEWIKENCIIDEKAEEWLNKLPAPYTLILKLKNKDCISKEVNCGSDTLSVRIPDHWFSKCVEKLKIPIITTSVNVSGDRYMTSLYNINEEIKSKVDFIIDEGEKKACPQI